MAHLRHPLELWRMRELSGPSLIKSLAPKSYSIGSSRGHPQRSRVFRFCKSNSTSETLIVSTAVGVIFTRNLALGN